jgi:RNA polymerase sigma-70 factor (ECF subfamily)
MSRIDGLAGLLVGGTYVADDARAMTHLETFNQHRTLLSAIAYRMLGSWADAEDAVQETFVRWQSAAGETIVSPRAFLVTIVSRLCINQLQSARARREEHAGQWLPEPILTGPPDGLDAAFRVDESLSTAFLVLLERLSPAERAVFLLREIFEYEYDEIATIVGQSATTCRQILHRARAHVAAGRPRFAASLQERRALAQEFLDASRSGNLRSLLRLLADDVAFYADGGGKAPAIPNTVHGAERVARLVIAAQQKFVPERVESRVLPINGVPGVVTYADGRPFSAVSFDFARDRIAAIYLVTNPDKLDHLGVLSTHLA